MTEEPVLTTAEQIERLIELMRAIPPRTMDIHARTRKLRTETTVIYGRAERLEKEISQLQRDITELEHDITQLATLVLGVETLADLFSEHDDCDEQ